MHWASVRVDELDRRRVVRVLEDVLALRVGVEELLEVGPDLLDLDLRAVQLLDRALEVARVGDDEPHVVAERQAQVVCAADVGRIGDRNEQEVVVHEPHRNRLVAEGEILLEQDRGGGIGLGLGEVDVLEPGLVGESPRKVGTGDPAVVDDDLAEAAAGQGLLFEGLLDLVHRQVALVDQQ